MIIKRPVIDYLPVSPVSIPEMRFLMMGCPLGPVISFVDVTFGSPSLIVNHRVRSNISVHEPTRSFVGSKKC